MKTVLITGANKGIGFETARQLVEKGYFIYLGCRDLEKGIEAKNKLNKEGLDSVDVIKIDISNSASVLKARQEIGKKIKSLDVLINNAGILGKIPQSPASMELNEMKRVFDTNYFGTINVTQTFFDLLSNSKSPRIVNVTTGLASLTLHNDPSWQFYKFKSAAYVPSKSALNAYTVTLAYELRDTPFKVNAVDPGYTNTEFNNHRGTKDVSDAASLIVKYALLDDKGPSGKYISYDNNPDTGISPW